MDDLGDRRAFLTMASAGMLLAACQKGEHADAAPSSSSKGERATIPANDAQPKEESYEDVGAT